MKHLYLFLLLSFFSLQGKAQISDNPLDVLTQKLYENELLSNRFIKNFVFIKTNTFKKKSMIDMDRSLAKFDDNLSYIILHLPYDRKVKDDFLKLQNLWNIYRLKITDYDKENYKSLILKTRKLEKYLKELNKVILEKHPAASANKKSINMAHLVVSNGSTIDKIAAAYVLKYGLNLPDAFDRFEIDKGALHKNLKKLGKFKPIAKDIKPLLADLKTTQESILQLVHKEKYNPKMMHAYDNAYTKKAFKLLGIIIKTIK